MNKKLYKNKDWLNQKYWNEELLPYQIAKLCNCSRISIQYWLKKLNIKTRSRGLSVHLARANHCHLSDEAKQWIDGELLGDGYLRSKSGYSASFQYVSKYKEYINYISDILESFGIKQCGKINKEYYKKLNCYDYRYHSLSYVELLPIRKRWYPNQKKIIPRDLKLTPLVLRQEMIGDGYLAHPEDSRPHIQLATNGFISKDVEWLVSQLNKLGFKSTRKPFDNSIRISTYSTKDFLEYIGESPVKCYQYKFSYQ